MKKNEEKGTPASCTIFAFPLILWTGIVMTVLMMAIYIVMMCFRPSESQYAVPFCIVLSTVCIGVPVLSFVFGARRGFVRVRIDETGIHRSMLGKFFKLSMSWDDIREISFFVPMGVIAMPFLMFSKTKSIRGLSYWKISNIKDLVQIQLSKKVYSIVMLYIKQPIVGLTDDIKLSLKLIDETEKAEPDTEAEANINEVADTTPDPVTTECADSTEQPKDND